jgi:hypothetical protein
MRNLTILLISLSFLLTVGEVQSKPPTKSKVVKSKFYDFNDQLIDGVIRKPTSLYLDVRQKAKFVRLLRLKKSFLPDLFKTAKESLFK